MPFEAKSDTQIVILRAMVKAAREWALLHFNAAHAEERSMLGPVSFFVEFPDVDRMVVHPSFLGQRGEPAIEYRLAFANYLEWRGKHPFWGTPLPPLRVLSAKQVKESLDRIVSEAHDA